MLVRQRQANVMAAAPHISISYVLPGLLPVAHVLGPQVLGGGGDFQKLFSIVGQYTRHVERRLSVEATFAKTESTP